MSLKVTGKINSDNLGKSLSREDLFFLAPEHPRQRQYEALRAYFVDQKAVKDVAAQFGYTVGAFHALCYQFRRDKKRQFFIETRPGPKHSPKRDRSREQVVLLRKKNFSVLDIQAALRKEGADLSSVSIWTILKEEGFSKLPRRKDEELPEQPRAERAEYADIRQLTLNPRVFQTRVGGSLFTHGNFG